MSGTILVLLYMVAWRVGKTSTFFFPSSVL
jgi:hypothetical protein